MGRLAGHAARYDTGNGVCVKPKCKCGWVGYAQPTAGARAQYRNHVEVARMRRAQTTPQPPAPPAA